MQELIVKGEAVTYNFFPGETPAISHGEFSIRNPGKDIQTLEIEECFFIDGNTKNKIDNFFVYAGDSEFSKTISMPATSELKIRVTFPSQMINEKQRNAYSVEITVAHGKEILKAISEIKIEWEKSM